MAPAFRSASIDDLPAIERLLVAAGLPTAGVSELIASDASQFLVVSTHDLPSELLAVGALEICRNHALLRSVAVRSDWQRRGLGLELIRRIVSEAETRGVQALYLLTLTAEHYFPRFGFERISRDDVPADIAATLEFRSACPASAIAMTRSLVS